MTSRNAPRCVVCHYKFKKGEDTAVNEGSGERAHVRCVGKVGGVLRDAPKTFTADQVNEMITSTEAELAGASLTRSVNYFDALEEFADLLREKLGVDEEGEPEERSIVEPPLAHGPIHDPALLGALDALVQRAVMPPKQAPAPKPPGFDVTDLRVFGPTTRRYSVDGNPGDIVEITERRVPEPKIREVMNQADLDAIEAEVIATGNPVEFSMRSKDGKGFSFPYLKIKFQPKPDAPEPEVETLVHLVDLPEEDA